MIETKPVIACVVMFEQYLCVAGVSSGTGDVIVIVLPSSGVVGGDIPVRRTRTDYSCLFQGQLSPWCGGGGGGGVGS